MTKSHNQSQASSDEAYFNLQVSGCGYLSRVRWVNPSSKGRKSEPFLACAVNALRGAVTDPAYTYFDLRVSGEEAGVLVEQLKQDVDANRKVFIAFKLGDIYPHSYERKAFNEHGKPTGEMETATLIKGRLLLITYVKVDDEVVYQRKDDDENGDDAGEREAPQGAEREPQQRQGGEAQAPRTPAQEEGGNARSQRRQAATPVKDRSRVRDYVEA
ncbi:MAG: DUF3577 domain-containing protein [Burkholderiales bacterium]|nr:DUF3577 domain-containing protein [Burkholderiales bacterium]